MGSEQKIFRFTLDGEGTTIDFIREENLTPRIEIYQSKYDGVNRVGLAEKDVNGKDTLIIETGSFTFEFRGHGLWEHLIKALRTQTTLLNKKVKEKKIPIAVQGQS